MGPVLFALFALFTLKSTLSNIMPKVHAWPVNFFNGLIGVAKRCLKISSRSSDAQDPTALGDKRVILFRRPSVENNPVRPRV
jgi:hypothetical protein